MYPVRRTAFPTDQTVEVPSYRIDAFNGKNLELTPDSWRVKVDFAALPAPSIANALKVQREGWEIYGLIALDALPFARAFKQAVDDGNARRFGTVLDEAWYFLAPIELEFAPRAGEVVVVGLYR